MLCRDVQKTRGVCYTRVQSVVMYPCTDKHWQILLKKKQTVLAIFFSIFRKIMIFTILCEKENSTFAFCRKRLNSSSSDYLVLFPVFLTDKMLT